MIGQTVQDIMRELDPATRFILRHDIVSTAADIARMIRIPDVENAAIYAPFYDMASHVCIGIAQSPDSNDDSMEWHDEQCRFPVLRSVDRVDILGLVIRDLTEGPQ